jgi:hypothetical protein
MPPLMVSILADYRLCVNARPKSITRTSREKYVSAFGNTVSTTILKQAAYSKSLFNFVLKGEST